MFIKRYNMNKNKLIFLSLISSLVFSMQMSEGPSAPPLYDDEIIVQQQELPSIVAMPKNSAPPLYVLELEDEITRLKNEIEYKELQIISQDVIVKNKIESMKKGVSKLNNLLYYTNLSVYATTFSLCGLAFVPLFRSPTMNNLLSFFSLAGSLSYLLHNLEMNYQLNKLENRVSN
jgi:hypothetical protein